MLKLECLSSWEASARLFHLFPKTTNRSRSIICLSLQMILLCMILEDLFCSWKQHQAALTCSPWERLIPEPGCLCLSMTPTSLNNPLIWVCGKTRWELWVESVDPQGNLRIKYSEFQSRGNRGPAGTALKILDIHHFHLLSETESLYYIGCWLVTMSCHFGHLCESGE